MSQNLESPGFADAKMDISSEATSQSQESPDDDGDGTFQQRELTTLPSEEPDEAPQGGVPKSRSFTRCGLTLTSSHPLQQSPTVTDSDSENGHHRGGGATKSSRFVFPDVVPENETTHQRLHTTARPTISSLDVVDNPHGRRKVAPMRDLSGERMASSGSEQDLSQYQASVTPSFQSVALVSRSVATSSGGQVRKHTTKVPTDQLSDVSSVESLSNRSFDDDFDPQVLSGSPVSSLFDNNILNDDDDNGATRLEVDHQSTDSMGVKHKIVLPDGRTREIDMKVIEPYQRVLSHGGYLKTAGHNAIIIFSACYLPDRSRMDYHYVMDNLFLYVVQTLEQLVTDDYVMIYLHGGCCKNNVPPFHWLRKCYQLLDRRLRKSLKTLYMVHPTFWLKSLVIMSRPFISSKFWRKFIYVKNLEDLYSMVPVEKAAIPEKVKQFNARSA